ncbi:cytochrome P450 9e2-like [Phymastichus coffea]|uniref:cytochrome P450 9e2-like n=1 Tax=Phymastichus coffea TaxID=108790 RepID=UPI00273AA856|nr:cytochrome P450 9e2-like [Phymastichus coffea]
MDYYILTFLFVIVYLIYIYLKNNYSYFERLEIPYLSGWPILGSLTGPILRRKHMTQVFQELYDLDSDAKYVGAFNFTKPVFVIRDLELIKNITIKNFDYFPDHNPIGDESLDPLFGGNLFNLKGQRWKDSRTVLSSSFTSSKMKMMFGLMVDCADDFVGFIDKQPSEKLKIVDTKDLFGRYTTNVIASCAFGIQIDSLRNPTNKFFVLSKKAAIIGPLLGLKIIVSRVFPGIMKALKIRLFSKELSDFFTDVISETVKTRDDNGITRPDMLQLMMDARKLDEKNVKFDINGMTCQAFVFFFAGFDTTTSVLCAFAHELALHHNVQSKLQEEIDGIIKETNGKPTYEAIAGMQYLDAAFHETVRLHGQASFLDRVCKIPFELPPALPGGKPIMLRPGSTIWIPAAAIHRDPKHYANPNQFDPDRYYGKKITINDATTLGFGIGPRSCIGNRFAILEIKILLFHLLSKYTLCANEKTCAPFKYSKKTFSIQPDGGFWLSIIPRNSTAILHNTNPEQP